MEPIEVFWKIEEIDLQVTRFRQMMVSGYDQQIKIVHIPTGIFVYGLGPFAKIRVSLFRELKAKIESEKGKRVRFPDHIEELLGDPSMALKAYDFSFLDEVMAKYRGAETTSRLASLSHELATECHRLKYRIELLEGRLGIGMDKTIRH